MNTNFEAIMAELELAKVEAEKFFGEKANAQAGKRLRANMQNIVKAAKLVRNDVTSLKESRQVSK